MESTNGERKLRAAQRVLSCIAAGAPADAADIDVVRSSALPDERDLELDELARAVAERNRYPWNKP
jgi:hypothetical protein